MFDCGMLVLHYEVMEAMIEVWGEAAIVTPKNGEAPNVQSFVCVARLVTPRVHSELD